MRATPVWAVLLLVAVTCPSAVGAASAKNATSLAPRPITDAERAAIGMLLAYSTDGAAALANQLAPESPWATLAVPDAVLELEARLGPRQHATWILATPADPNDVMVQIEDASGLVDSVRFVLDPPRGQDPEWRVLRLESLLEPTKIIRTNVAQLQLSTAPIQPGWGRPSNSATGARLTPLLALIAGIFLAVATTRRIHQQSPSLTFSGRAIRRPVFATVLVALAVGSCGEPEVAQPNAAASAADQAAASAAAAMPLRLGSLAPVRLALARGDRADATRLAGQLPASAWGAGQLVLAADALGRGELEQAAQLLAQAKPKPAADPQQLPQSSTPEHGELDAWPPPMVPLLSARLALARGEPGTVVEDYAEVLLRQDHDLLSREAALAAWSRGEIEEARDLLRKAAGHGSRHSQTYASLASLTVAYDLDPTLAREALRTAWALDPWPRGQVFRDPTLAFLAADPELFAELGLSAASEAVVAPASPQGDGPVLAAIALPTTARATRNGSTLQVTLLGETKLDVPGGAQLAVSAATIDARTRDRQLAERAIGRFSQLMSRASTSGAAAGALRRREIEETAWALTERHRFADVIALTDLPEAAAIQSPLLTRLRGKALLETGDALAARTLLTDLALNELALTRRQPGTLFDLAELCVETGQHELAIRLLERASAISPTPRGSSRVSQVMMERDLLADSERLELAGFTLVFPRSTGRAYPQNLGKVLLAERQRLQRYLPESGRKAQIEVQLFPHEAFFAHYGHGVAVLGLFDGKVRVPLADLPTLHPIAISLLAHEISHALITERTADRAPRWFQEGLAQLASNELVSINPVPDLIASGHLLAFDLIEDVLAGFSEPQLVELAYQQSSWALRFIEARWGIKGIERLLNSFAAGADTDAALAEAFGLGVAEFDLEFRRWATNQVSPQIVTHEPIRYDIAAADDEIVTFPSRQSSPGAASSNSSATPEPRVGATRVATPKEDPAKALRAWHAQYAAAAQPVKLALAPVVRLLREGQKLEHAPSCNALNTATATFLDNTVALQSPLATVESNLREAYSRFARMATACARGNFAEARTHLDLAEVALQGAAQTLEAHDLAP